MTSRLTLDLHRNIQGGVIGRWALEKFRNRETNGVYREIISYELGLNFTLLSDLSAFFRQIQTNVALFQPNSIKNY